MSAQAFFHDQIAIFHQRKCRNIFYGLHVIFEMHASHNNQDEYCVPKNRLFQSD